MKISKLPKNISKYLPLLVVMILVVSGLFIANDLRQALFESQFKTPTRLSIESVDPQWSAGFGVTGLCASPYIYTSLPAKCRTTDGEFIQINGLPSNIVVIPELK